MLDDVERSTGIGEATLVLLPVLLVTAGAALAVARTFHVSSAVAMPSVGGVPPVRPSPSSSIHAVTGRPERRLVRSKLVPPARPDGLIVRQRVLDRLSSDRRFTLVSAMPGYGKTAAVRQ